MICILWIIRTKFERLNNQIKHFDMELLTCVPAYNVLKNENISHEKEQLIQATIIASYVQ